MPTWRKTSADDVPPTESPEGGLLARRLEYLFWCAGAVIGFLQIIYKYTFIEGDGIAYVDIGDAYVRGDLRNAINAYWSPVYSWLTGLTLAALKPSAYWELPVLHSINYVVFICSMFCFGFLLRELSRFQEELAAAAGEPRAPRLLSWMWVGVGYTAFLWCAIVTIGVTQTSPDMLVSLLVYLSAALTLRMRTAAGGRRTAVALGVTLGVGYLTKTILFPVGCAFLLVNLIPFPLRRPALRHVALAAALFCALAAPFVIAISVRQQRFTIGDSGRLNYSWSVNDNTKWLYWRGEVPRSGVAAHPPRIILRNPIINEFAEPISGTFPPWYDPPYWYEGVVVYFDLKQQLAVLVPNIGKLGGMFFHYPASKVITVLCLLLATLSGSRFSFASVFAHWVIIGPALAASLLYAMVVVVARYMGPFDVLIILGFLAGCRLPLNVGLRRVVKYLTAVFLFVAVVVIAWVPAEGAYDTARKLARGEEPHLHWQIAEALREQGLQPGDRVAAIGYIRAHTYARLSRTKVVAEMPYEFFLLTPRAHEQALAAFAQTDAKAIVAIPTRFLDNPAPPGWQQVGSASAYIYVLSRRAPSD